MDTVPVGKGRFASGECRSRLGMKIALFFLWNSTRTKDAHGFEAHYVGISPVRNLSFAGLRL
jgi:hypothetical protein